MPPITIGQAAHPARRGARGHCRVPGHGDISDPRPRCAGRLGSSAAEGWRGRRERDPEGISHLGREHERGRRSPHPRMTPAARSPAVPTYRIGIGDIRRGRARRGHLPKTLAPDRPRAALVGSDAPGLRVRQRLSGCPRAAAAPAAARTPAAPDVPPDDAAPAGDAAPGASSVTWRLAKRIPSAAKALRIRL